MQTTIQELENFIRSGQFDEVETRLRKLGKVDRKHAVAIANIARRINRPSLAFKMLNPIVRSDDRLQAPATALEKIEYAESLRRLGAVDEAWQLLNEVDSEKHPEATVHKIFCLFNQWKYSEALIILRKYVQSSTLTPYARCVGQINLAAALISEENLIEARDLLESLRAETKASDFQLLYGNSLELSAQVLILQKDFETALSLLEESSEVLKSAGNVASLFVEKWKAIAESLKQKKSTPELQDVFRRAQSERHWETVRDCDLYLAYLDQDLSRFERAYFGTPYDSFRQRILRFAGPKFQISSHYLWSVTPKSSSILNLEKGLVEGKVQAQLPTGQALHRFLILISQDFYKPVSTLSAFGKLFPDEFMNANTSANRVHQIVKRCREWLADAGVDLQIEETDGGYRMVLGADCGVLVRATPLPLSTKQLEWGLLESSVGQSVFDVHRACEILSSSASTAQRLLKWALADNRLEKLGQGSRTTYRVAIRLKK
jgi:tetratricopeptide (TPR) repeat protein